MNPQQMQMQQLQQMFAQLTSLMGQVNNQNACEPSKPAPQIEAHEPRNVQYVHGIDGAKEEQAKLNPGESGIVMDDSDNIFYFILKDKDGKCPRKIKVGHFTLEDEPDPPKYVTQADLEDFKADLLNALKGGSK